jgi:transcriptional regulator with GAF, ATPase, and Fis domain
VARAEERERELTEAFVALADSLVAEFDVLDLLDRLTSYCTSLLEGAASGLLVTDQHGKLQMVAASDESTRLLELFQMQNHEGPCADCFRTGEAVIVDDVRNAFARWPRFAPLAEAADLLSVHAFPMRLRDDVIGTLNVFRSSPGHLTKDDAVVAQALADIATISILQNRSIARGEVLATQLQTALESRVVIEQAKGIAAERAATSVDEAFQRLRAFARSGNRRLADVATAIVRGELDPRDLPALPSPR